MKKYLFTLLMVIVTLPLFAQSHLGWVTKQVNFREGPGTEYEVISSLKGGTQIFIISLDSENEYFNVIDIAENREGYVHRSYIKVGEAITANDGGIFTPSGRSDNYNPDLEIFNNTALNLTLKLNSQTFSFSPYERREISLAPGSYSYRASAPGVIPDIGTESIQSNMS